MNYVEQAIEDLYNEINNLLKLLGCCWTCIWRTPFPPNHKKPSVERLVAFFFSPQRSGLCMSNLSLEKLKAFKLNKRRLTIQLTVVIRFKTLVSFCSWRGAIGVASVGGWSFSLLSGKVFSLCWCSRPALC